MPSRRVTMDPYQGRDHPYKNILRMFINDTVTTNKNHVSI